MGQAYSYITGEDLQPENQQIEEGNLNKEDKSLQNEEENHNEPVQEEVKKIEKPSWNIMKTKLSYAWKVDSNIKKPVDLCFLANGQLAVSDEETRAITFYDEKGEKTERVIDTMDYQAEFHPGSICLYEESTVSVIECSHHCVVTYKYDEKRKKNRSSYWGWKVLEKPKGICRNQNGLYIVTDLGCKSISVYDGKGQRIRRFGEKYLESPENVTCDKYNRIYVIDASAKNIQVFDINGTHLYKFGDGQMTSPQGITTDPANNIIVTDQWNDSVLVYSPDGRFLGSLDFGETLHQPKCIAIDWERKKMAVSTKYVQWNQIKVFDIENV